MRFAMDVDVDFSHWILDFILRQPLANQKVDHLIRILPLPNSNAGLERRILVRKIESEIASNSLSEKLLELIEQVKELDNRHGVESSEAIKIAYCAVAVDCTICYLNENEEEDNYFEAVKRIWRGRVREMEKLEKGIGLISEELIDWYDLIEAIVWDKGVCEIAAKRRRRYKGGLEAVRDWINEEKERMGLSFLELVAEKIKDDDSLKEMLGWCEQVQQGTESLPSSGKDRVVCNSNKEVLKGNVLPRPKHLAKTRYRGTTSRPSRGVKIVDTEDWRVGTSYETDGIPPIPEVDKVQEALESSAFGLQAVVKDPLPDALHQAKNVMSRMARENMDQEPAVRDHNIASSNEPNPPVEKYAGAVRANEGDLGNQCCSQQNNSTKQSLMERNSTAHTSEWDDSVASLPEESPNRWRRRHLPGPKPRVVSPLKKSEVTKLAKRRKARRWSNLEEDGLRNGVQKFGHGNWKLILDAHRNVFEDRTALDLKDKWRNLTR